MCFVEDFSSVRAGIEEIKSAFEKINVICCNAGVMAVKDSATKDGYDVQVSAFARKVLLFAQLHF